MTSRLAFFCCKKPAILFGRPCPSLVALLGCARKLRVLVVISSGATCFPEHVLLLLKLAVPVYIYVYIYCIIFVYDKLYPLVLLYVFLVASCEYTHYSGIHHGTLSCYTLPGLFPLLLADHPHSCWDMCYMIYIHISY